MILQILLDGGGDIVIGQLHRGAGGGETLVLPQLYFGIEVDEGGEAPSTRRSWPERTPCSISKSTRSPVG